MPAVFLAECSNHVGYPGTLPAASPPSAGSLQDGTLAVFFFAETGKSWYIARTLPAKSRQVTGRNARIFLQILGFSRCCGTCLVNFRLFWGPGSQLGAMPPKRCSKGTKPSKAVTTFGVTFRTFWRLGGCPFFDVFWGTLLEGILGILVPKGLPKGCFWEQFL
jgi:hypothetical protein